MQKQIYFTAILIGLLFFSCNKEKKQDDPSDTSVVSQSTSTKDSVHPGKKLMETKCYVCHIPSAPEKQGRVGPPMIAIKAHYINHNTTKEEFTTAIWNFLEAPSEDKAKLKGAVSRFGVMPYQPFKKEDIEKIADYLYDYQIEEPEWFKEHWENGHKKKRKPYNNKEKISVEYSPNKPEDIGMSYALNTKKELGKNLMGTIQKKGTKAAVTFCNEKAYPITDSMARAQNVSIKRVSDQPRNSKNQANAKELDLINLFKKAIVHQEDYQPVTEENNGKVTFYTPITTNSMCLQCHGTPTKNIQPEVLKTITNLYPNDKAIGYNINEVRGMWRITYKK